MVNPWDLKKKPFVIADIGSNHCNSLKVFKDTISAAKESGCDAVKFQCLNISEQYHLPSREIQELHNQIDVREEWYPELFGHAKSIGITIFASPTYPRSIELLEAEGVELYKIASAQACSFPQLVKRVSETGKPIIISNGLTRFTELANVLKYIDLEKVCILHCNSIYPTPLSKANIMRIERLKNMFNCTIGYSDHTLGSTAAVCAVSRGASVFEKHFTLDKSIMTPDLPVSVDPREMKEYITAINDAQICMGNESRESLESEEEIFRAKLSNKIILQKISKNRHARTTSYTKKIFGRIMLNFIRN